VADVWTVQQMVELDRRDAALEVRADLDGARANLVSELVHGFHEFGLRMSDGERLCASARLTAGPVFEELGRIG
jgi:hypothetical protein